MVFPCTITTGGIVIIQQTSNTNKISFLNRLYVTVQPRLVVEIKATSEYLVASMSMSTSGKSS